jgi:outer membrane protein OmpA-like peptidoglycan-associated protein
MMLRSAGFLSLSSLTLCLTIEPVQAQYFTNHGGYTNSGAYHIQLELSPYLWLPAANGSFTFAHAAGGNHSAGSPVASRADLVSTVHSSFVGDGLLRYGPYSAELELQDVNASGSKTLSGEPDSSERRDASYVRVAPGLGYQFYRGNVFSIPASVDARTGFSYFESQQQIRNEGNPNGEAGRNVDFVQPWIGTRIDFLPANNWRIELAGLVQGIGIANGSWGWGASGIISYAVNDWFAVDVGYKANNSGHNGSGLNAPKRSLELKAYGPMFGVTVRFGSSPPSPPAPTFALAAAPVPVQARTYLLFFDWDSAVLTPRAVQVVAQAAWDSGNQNLTTIKVNGYTDSAGTAAYDKGLSLRRANAVETQLVADGVPESEIGVRGFGDNALLVPAAPGVIGPQNRRIEIVLQ